MSWETAARIQLSVDAPSPRTGTGSAVVLDGSDVALVRATVVDAHGHEIVTGPDAQRNVTFRVASGFVRVIGTANGDPASHIGAHSPTISMYHGLARAVVGVTLKATGSAEERSLEQLVNPEAGVRMPHFLSESSPLFL